MWSADGTAISCQANVSGLKQKCPEPEFHVQWDSWVRSCHWRALVALSLYPSSLDSAGLWQVRFGHFDMCGVGLHLLSHKHVSCTTTQFVTSRKNYSRFTPSYLVFQELQRAEIQDLNRNHKGGCRQP